MAAALRAQAPADPGRQCRRPRGVHGTTAFRDRLTLTEARVEAMARGLEDVAALPDPLGRILADWTRPNGLRIQRIATPIGVIGMIYESRPNVGADASALCLKSGNAVILRGGSDSATQRAGDQRGAGARPGAAGPAGGLHPGAPSADRAYVAAMLAGAGLLDLIIPRGGKSLVERVQREARVPVLAHAEGLCHTYVHAAADPAMARAIVANAKMRRTGVCGATETLLIDRAIAPALLPPIVADLRALGCDFRADAAARDDRARPAGGERCGFRYRMAGCGHVRRRGGWRRRRAGAHRPPRQRAHRRDHHRGRRRRRAIPAPASIARSALWNASTQFCDGGEFGFGAEIGIATGRIHARGPVGLEQLTTYRYVVRGNGPGASLNAVSLTLPRFGDRRRMRVGLLGGSFNPAHAGHRHVAELALRRLRLDQVWLLVSPGNPLKPQRGMAPLAERLAGARGDRRRAAGRRHARSRRARHPLLPSTRCGCCCGGSRGCSSSGSWAPTS